MSAIFYQLTVSAAQLCAPVTAVADGDWTGWLDHWQTLLGAAVGGLMGVVGALTVAGAQHRREQRIAAGMVLPDLQQLVAAAERLERVQPPPQRADVGSDPFVVANELFREKEQRRATIVDRLTVDRPALFALHTPVIGQLTDVDARLYSHLFQCEMIHRRFEDGLGARQVDRNTGPSARQLHDQWRLCAEHAALANHFLDLLVFAQWPMRWAHRLRMKWWPNDIENRSADLIRTGHLPEEADSHLAARPAATPHPTEPT